MIFLHGRWHNNTENIFSENKFGVILPNITRLSAGVE